VTEKRLSDSDVDFILYQAFHTVLVGSEFAIKLGELKRMHTKTLEEVISASFLCGYVKEEEKGVLEEIEDVISSKREKLIYFFKRWILFQR